MCCCSDGSKLQAGLVVHSVRAEYSSFGQLYIEGYGATLATVLFSANSSYCAVSSVAAPPRHPVPLFQIIVYTSRESSHSLVHSIFLVTILGLDSCKKENFRRPLKLE